MADILKFPETAFERLTAAGKRRPTANPDAEAFFGGCAAAVWLGTEHARAIAYRTALWIVDHADIRADGYSVAFPVGWHFEMVHGRPPFTDEDAAFWQEMRGTTDAFRQGFTRGVVGAVALMLRQDQRRGAASTVLKNGTDRLH